MAKIGQPQTRAPAWPWGGPTGVREKLVNKAQLDRKNVRKKGDPKNPALASTALLASIGPARSAEGTRPPLPPSPAVHASDGEGYLDRGPLNTVAERLAEANQEAMQRGLGAIRAPPERVDRLKSLLARESSMLELVGTVSNDMAEIERRRREEQLEEGY